MKLLISFFLLLISLYSLAQKRVYGIYKGKGSSETYELTLNPDSSFKYEWFFSVDGICGWSKGSWIIRKHIVSLKLIPVYDTMLFYDTIRNKNIDSLILSLDEKSDRKDYERISLRSIVFIGRHQDERLSDSVFYYRRGMLYLVDEKTKRKNKTQKGLFSKKVNDPLLTKE